MSGKLNFEDYKRLKADLNLCKVRIFTMSCYPLIFWHYPGLGPSRHIHDSRYLTLI
jgi:hypothetical protein